MLNIIAEAGVNFRNLDEAFQFIDEAKRLNLFAVKYQLYSEEQIKQADPKHQEFLRSIQLSWEDAGDLYNYGKKIGQEVFFTPMFLEAVDFLRGLDVSLYKIRFKDRYNSEILDKVLATNKPVFVSNPFLKVNFQPLNYYPLYCIPEYPAKSRYHPTDIDTQYFRGVSDHSQGTKLLEHYLRILRDFRDDTFWYFEKHVYLDSNPNCLEKDWSVSFSELEKVLKEVNFK